MATCTLGLGHGQNLSNAPGIAMAPRQTTKIVLR